MLRMTATEFFAKCDNPVCNPCPGVGRSTNNTSPYVLILSLTPPTPTPEFFAPGTGPCLLLPARDSQRQRRSLHRRGFARCCKRWRGGVCVCLVCCSLATFLGNHRLAPLPFFLPRGRLCQVQVEVVGEAAADVGLGPALLQSSLCGHGVFIGVLKRARARGKGGVAL